MRTLARNDLYFLLRYGLNRADAEHPWIFERCREVQANPNGFLDLWSRGHYKSTIITFALTIQDVLRTHGDGAIGEEVTIGIFSHTRPIAKTFLRQIKMEFENNGKLKEWFPDILYDNPSRDALKWSVDDGILVRRRSNPKESTIEAYGLVDGQPTSKHYGIRVYDDVVTRESVSNSDAIKRTNEAWGLSLNLAAKDGLARYIGTRYREGDTYEKILNTGAAIERRHGPYPGKKRKGPGVLMSETELDERRKRLGPYIWSCQMLQNPRADSRHGFKNAWLRWYDDIHSGEGMNSVILCDPANEKKRDSDYTSMWVVGLAADKNYYILDGLRDRLGIVERRNALFAFHRRWRPNIVGYEHYGMQADIGAIEEQQERENYRFQVIPLGGAMPKDDRIKRLVPIFEQRRMYFPHNLWKATVEGVSYDLVDQFLEDEYRPFPVSSTRDMLDCLSRIVEDDLGLLWPNEQYAGPIQYPDLGLV